MGFNVPRERLPMYGGIATLMLAFTLRLYNFGAGNAVQDAFVQAIAPAIGVYLGLRVGLWYFCRGTETG